jgi:hypothetical protein
MASKLLLRRGGACKAFIVNTNKWCKCANAQMFKCSNEMLPLVEYPQVPAILAQVRSNPLGRDLFVIANVWGRYTIRLEREKDYEGKRQDSKKMHFSNKLSFVSDVLIEGNTLQDGVAACQVGYARFLARGRGLECFALVGRSEHGEDLCGDVLCSLHGNVEICTVLHDLPGEINEYLSALQVGGEVALFVASPVLVGVKNLGLLLQARPE